MTGHPPTPILVTGMPRSGTTWVGRMIDASGCVGYLNEPFNLATDPGTLRVPVGRWFPYVTEENEHEILPALTELLAFQYPLARELAKCRTGTAVRHTLKWWRSYARSRGLRPLVKEPHAVFSIEWFRRRLASDVVVTVRHPAAVVSSWKRLEWDFDFENLLGQPALARDWLEPYADEMRAAATAGADLVDRIALLWDVVYRVVDGHRQRMPAILIARQEDYALDPVGCFRELYDALQLPFEADAATAVTASSQVGNLSEPPADAPHETRLDSRAGLDSWRRRLDADEIARIRRRTEETASRFYAEISW